jgi:hypothetical protein
MRLSIAAVLLGLVALSGCTSVKERTYFLGSVEDDAHPPTYLGMPLQSGQVVLSEAPGAYSFLFSIGTERYSNFTHGGILVMEEGKPFVYEMTGEYKVGFHDAPTDGIEGYCRKLPFMDYVRGNLYVEVFDPPEGVDSSQVTTWVQTQYRDQPEFDAYFNWNDHEALFCNEFVQLALEAGGGAPVELRQVRQNPSLQRMLVWAKVENEWGLTAGTFADPDRSVTALGQFSSRTAATCYFAAKEEIHRRFGPDQVLGNIFVMTSLSDIVLRQEIVFFLREAVLLFAEKKRKPSSEAIRAAIAELAERLFGVGTLDPASQAG